MTTATAAYGETMADERMEFEITVSSAPVGHSGSHGGRDKGGSFFYFCRDVGGLQVRTVQKPCFWYS